MTKEEILENFKTSIEFAHDFENTQKCFSLLRKYNRNEACTEADKIVAEYAEQINLFGFLFDGTKVDYTKRFDLMSDEQIKWQLQYLENHIPIYALLRKGEKELAKQLIN